MSGHSHFAGIKHQKAITDAQRGRAFSKLTREISIAARGGANPETNAKLRVEIEKAKAMNMPRENIERAIKKGVGETSGGEHLEEFLFEAYGPGGVAILIEGITDNIKRTLGEVKQVLAQNGGKFVESGSVKWLFERKGVITISSTGEQIQMNKDDLELKMIEAGAEDIYWHDSLLDVFTKPEDLEKVREILRSQGIKMDSASLDWVAKEPVGVDEKDKASCQKLFENLDENDAVQEIYSNLAA